MLLKKTFSSKGEISTSAVIILLIVSFVVPLTTKLVQQRQEIRKKAAQCEPGSAKECKTDCPSDAVPFCGGHQYCRWSADGNHFWSKCICEAQKNICFPTPTLPPTPDKACHPDCGYPCRSCPSG